MSADPNYRHPLVDHVPEPNVAVSTAVVEAVSSVSGIQPKNLQPLADALDPDALDRLVASQPDGEIRFSYNGYRVTVHGNSRVEVYEDL